MNAGPCPLFLQLAKEPFDMRNLEAASAGVKLMRSGLIEVFAMICPFEFLASWQKRKTLPWTRP